MLTVYPLQDLGFFLEISRDHRWFCECQLDGACLSEDERVDRIAESTWQFGEWRILHFE